MPQRGKYSHKSIGLRVVDEIGGYWDVIKGIVRVKSELKKEII